MNPQQYYQYQLAASAGVQRMPMYAPAHYIANPAALTGGIQLSHLPPPPPPPSAIAGLHHESTQMAAFASVSNANLQGSASAVPAGVTTSGSDTDPKNSEKGKVEQLTTQKNASNSKVTSVSLGGTTTNTTMMSGAVQPTSMIMPSGQTPSLISGVYAGAYIQQAIPQQHAPVQQPQYMLAASAGMQQQAAAAAAQQKLMYVPQMPATPQHMQPAAAGAFMQPTLFQDQSGKTYVLNGNQAQHPAYQFAQPQLSGKSPLAPPVGQQYVLASPYYYPQMQAQASFQGVIRDPRAAPGSAVTAIQPSQPGAPNQQHYHYY